MQKILNKKVILIFLILLITYKFYSNFKAQYYMSKYSGLWYCDFKVNYLAAINFWKSPEKLYTIKPYVSNYTYFPGVAGFLYKPISILFNNLLYAQFFWSIINHILLLIILYLVYKNFYNKINFWFLLLIVFILYFKPLNDNLIKFGNIKIILLYLYIIFYLNYKKNNYIFSSFIYSLLIFLSIQPLIFIPYFMFQKKYKFLIYSFVYSFVFVLITILFSGHPIVIYYKTINYFFVVIPDLFLTAVTASPYIQSFDAMAKRLFLANNNFTISIYNSLFLMKLFPLFFKIIIFSLTFFICYKNKNDLKYNIFNLVFITMVLIHSINWEYHYTILIFSFLLLLKNKLLYNKKYLYFLFVLYFIIFLKIPYDNVIFTQNKFLLIFTNTKLLSLLLIYLIETLNIKKTNHKRTKI